MLLTAFGMAGRAFDEGCIEQGGVLPVRHQGPHATSTGSSAVTPPPHCRIAMQSCTPSGSPRKRGLASPRLCARPQTVPVTACTQQ